VKIERREHAHPASLAPYVRYHVVDQDGQCIPEVCVGTGRLCGYPRKEQARHAAACYRREISVVGRR
jgi:hypothetical protein